MPETGDKEGEMPAEKFYRNGEMNLKAEWGACRHDNHAGRSCDGLVVEGGHAFEPGNLEHLDDLDRFISALKRAKRHLLGTSTGVDRVIDEVPPRRFANLAYGGHGAAPGKYDDGDET